MTRVHTQVRPLHPQTQADAEAVSVSSSISGGMAVCGGLPSILEEQCVLF